MAELWFYLDGSEARGPYERKELLARIAAQTLPRSVLVAQAGASAWQAASDAFSELRREPQVAAAASAASASARSPGQEQTVPIRAIAGRDAGRTYWIGSTPLSFGPEMGLAPEGAFTAELHGGRVRIRAAGGSVVRFQGQPQPEGWVALGESFEAGPTRWEVGRQPVSSRDVVRALADRLNELASVERLEGFSLREFFSEVFQKRSSEELDGYFLVGTPQTTPPLEEVPTGWPKPWLFFRILGFLGLVYLGFYVAIQQFQNPRLLPGLIMMGSLAVPFAVLILFFELNAPRNVSFRQVLSLFFLGGIASLFVSLIGFSVTDLSWLGASSAGIVEEVSKLAAVVVLAGRASQGFILNGLLFGAAVGAGFAAFESAGYAFWDALMETGSISYTTYLIFRRALLSPFAHVAWTALAAAALWRVKGSRPFQVSMLFEPQFLKAFAIPVVLHMLWNSPIPATYLIKYAVLGSIGWFLVFGFVQQGLRQIKQEQRERARVQLDLTRSLTGPIPL